MTASPPASRQRRQGSDRLNMHVEARPPPEKRARLSKDRLMTSFGHLVGDLPRQTAKEYGLSISDPVVKCARA